ncbi:MAG: Jag N-terminal domain-containing protein [Clostridia bacterium]|nr:Jag N-terminal domain-containing protein [Clostridia bacterium]
MNNYFTGKTVDEAVALALNTLGISQDEADITVIEEASKGIFGIGAHPAKVLVTKKEIKTEVKTEDDDLNRTVAFLEGLFDILKTAVSIETSV